jgi:hypothetical protein
MCDCNDGRNSLPVGTECPMGFVRCPLKDKTTKTA